MRTVVAPMAPAERRDAMLGSGRGKKVMHPPLGGCKPEDLGNQSMWLPFKPRERQRSRTPKPHVRKPAPSGCQSQSRLRAARTPATRPPPRKFAPNRRSRLGFGRNLKRNLAHRCCNECPGDPVAGDLAAPRRNPDPPRATVRRRSGKLIALRHTRPQAVITKIDASDGQGASTSNRACDLGARPHIEKCPASSCLPFGNLGVEAGPSR